MRTTWIRLFCTVALAGLASCESFGSGAGSRSSGTGGGASVDAAYRRDLHSYTVASLARTDAPGELLRGVSRIAELHGITDWESAPATVEALRDAAQDPAVDDAARDRLRDELAPLGDELLRQTELEP
jgi:hypothetical protein